MQATGKASGPGRAPHYRRAGAPTGRMTARPTKRHIPGGLRRGRLTPVLAPRMPVITEDVVWANRGRKCDSTAKGYIKNKSRLNEKEKHWNQIMVIMVTRRYDVGDRTWCSHFGQIDHDLDYLDPNLPL